MNEGQFPSPALFVEPFLVAPTDPEPEPRSRYDEDRDLTVLEDGAPLVETATVGGTETETKALGERSDADDAPCLSTTTWTGVKIIGTEHEDDDAPLAWGGTQIDTRRFPADIEQD